MKKMFNKKGFTLAELLVVVAIIAVLVAIAIPVFSAQLEKARDGVSVANIRSAYAEAQIAYLTNASGGNATYAPATAGSDGGEGTPATVKVTGVEIKSQQSNTWSGLATELPFWSNTITIQDEGKAGTYEITFTYTADAISAVSMTKK